MGVYNFFSLGNLVVLSSWSRGDWLVVKVGDESQIWPSAQQIKADRGAIRFLCHTFAIGSKMDRNRLKIAFVDRDGTINVDRGFVYRIEDWEFTPSACQGLAILCQAGFQIAVVTNQSGIASGLYTRDDAERLHAFMRQQLAEAGIRVDSVVYCPHAPEAICDCRKPQIGMARIVEAELGMPIDYAASWTIGDKLSDIDFGKSLGTKTSLIRSQYWNDGDVASDADLIVDSLFEAAQRITADYP